tara:strand:- start:191 stop:718 length:528 start_codon:yes stop_codon:yes gene_type:complete
MAYPYSNNRTSTSSLSSNISLESTTTELGGGWKECRDDHSGGAYYYNVHSGEVSWSRPVTAQQVVISGGGDDKFALDRSSLSVDVDVNVNVNVDVDVDVDVDDSVTDASSEFNAPLRYELEENFSQLEDRWLTIKAEAEAEAEAAKKFTTTSPTKKPSSPLMNHHHIRSNPFATT